MCGYVFLKGFPEWPEKKVFFFFWFFWVFLRGGKEARCAI